MQPPGALLQQLLAWLPAAVSAALPVSLSASLPVALSAPLPAGLRRAYRPDGAHGSWAG